MSDLSLTALIMGGIGAAIAAILWAMPAQARRWIVAFPRSDYPAYVLAAVDLLWAGWLLYHAHLGRFEHLKPYIYIAVPISFALIVYLVRDLLAPRALGGLILLFCDPILAAARWHESPLRLVVTVSAYVLVVWAMALVLSPHLFRKTFAAINGDNRAKTLGAGLAIYSGILLLLAWTVF